MGTLRELQAIDDDRVASECKGFDNVFIAKKATCNEIHDIYPVKNSILNWMWKPLSVNSTLLAIQASRLPT